MALENAITQRGFKEGIPTEQMDYFKYLMIQGLQAVPEGSEMPEEAIQEMVEKVKAVSGGKKKATSTVGGKNPEKKPSDDSGDVSYDEFKVMNIVQKQDFYHKNKDLYLKYSSMAKQKGELV